MKVKGYACHYNTPNANGEIVDENSFRKVLQERKEDGIAIPINYLHDSMVMIGKVTNFYSDSEGLFIEADLIDELDIVKNFVAPLVKNGVIDSFSTEGYIRKADIEKRPNNTYYASNFELTAVAIVNLPADKKAKFTTNGKTYFDAFDDALRVAHNNKKGNRSYLIV